jgi:2-polyprenyl-3-methyl-5-hydroxy-6-metoxy-1,4-benzoquinol methylase
MSDELTQFKDCFREAAPAFFQEFLRTEAAEPNTLARLGGSMLGWAKVALGDEYADLLIEGYCSFVMEVNRAQRTYEASGHYEYSTFSEVYVKAYSNKDFMNLYHWGVYCSTFIWLHHLKIYQFFERYFLPILANQQEVGQLVDLGSGSGIWHLLALEQLPSWQVTAVDISEPSIEMSARMASDLPCSQNIRHVCADATRWKSSEPMDAGISCFLLEHLERPQELLSSLSAALKPGAHAFITGAITAAEIDHIYEFKSEGEILSLVESVGFRVKHLYSAEPVNTPRNRKYLPRSLAMVVQKRHNEVW